MTYNDKAFRFDFNYCMTTADGREVKENGWSMYGTKSATLGNVSAMANQDYYQKQAVAGSGISSGDVFSVTIDGTQFGSSEKAVESILGAMQAGGTIQGVAGTPTQQEEVKNPYYEEDCLSFGLMSEPEKTFYVKTAYYTTTGNLYNYMCDPNSEGISSVGLNVGVDGSYHGTNQSVSIGYYAQNMCFHYLFPAEDVAE